MAKSTISKDPVSEQDKFMLRLPAGMRDAIREEADANGRSMNAEIVHRLENSLDPSFFGSEFKRVSQNYEASTSAVNHFLQMLAEKKVLYVALDAEAVPISWPEVMTNLNAIASALEGPIEKIDAAVFTPQVSSSRIREDAWFALLDFFRKQRGDSDEES
ncbi:Arc family DNA-binding protein [Rhizobium binxianense]|uniref:Arc family DNA-binding protein n=1 Tax=Rhizobium binxianense TaxID=3024242 RepID=UPI00234E6254|nr:Arc family DNA-binding protein [Rhizobium sp. BC56]MDC7745006.1 Arc family DNA-binding protein [Rhizobium sp. BC56]